MFHNQQQKRDVAINRKNHLEEDQKLIENWKYPSKAQHQSESNQTDENRIISVEPIKKRKCLSIRHLYSCIVPRKKDMDDDAVSISLADEIELDLFSLRQRLTDIFELEHERQKEMLNSLEEEDRPSQDEEVRTKYLFCTRGPRYRRNGVCRQVDKQLCYFDDLTKDILVESSLKTSGLY
ncbi:unnamed protein product [Didymodactylos carnosus]|uniref:Uncharacterized protein n=1 Tax=Didymodactylos carnosus TaxID=1234261 RepID=A0A815JXX2_9BILA|nr:unnamed protein product [Didymodactylos carnosus]CAF1385974.1 unnamed protein product [Didymodactylos carnosus]CAF4076863.1 unnamed protein product [Didymodactylos carnosus]CAF4281046.1 unnamed protein product [Didymodactylos carnosus]